MVTSDRMEAIDRNAAALGIPQRVLMESSGNAIAKAIRAEAPSDSRVCFVCGRGNNAGDAYVAARFLTDFSVSIQQVGRPALLSTESARENWDVLTAAEYDISIYQDASELALPACDIIVDALCGTGLRGALREPEATAARLMNEHSAFVLSVDVPSGLDADTGEAPGVVVDADHIITFHDTKPGLTSIDTPLTVATIGIPRAAERFVGPGDIASSDRATDSHKGDAGRILVIGGGPYTGAPALSGLAALRMGADLVTIATPDTIASTVQGYAPDLIVRPLPGDRINPSHEASLSEQASAADCVVIGPGIGDAAETRTLLERFFATYDGRAIVDAEALDPLTDIDTDASLICTPHRGEFSRLGGSLTGDWEERLSIVQENAKALDQTLVVKGSYDLIADGTDSRANRTGNPGMTVGGTGDVLAGVIAALYADDRRTAFEAGCIGTYLTGAAGDEVAAAKGHSLIASDVLEALPHVAGGMTHDG